MVHKPLAPLQTEPRKVVRIIGREEDIPLLVSEKGFVKEVNDSKR